MKKKTPHTESYPLLRDAYAIIDGIPDEHIDLAKWKTCDTVFCAAGWLAQHPKFKALGFELVKYNCFGHVVPVYRGNKNLCALALLFGLPDVGEAFYLFRSAEGPSRVSDKQIFLRRVREFLKDNA